MSVSSVMHVPVDVPAVQPGHSVALHMASEPQVAQVYDRVPRQVPPLGVWGVQPGHLLVVVPPQPLLAPQLAQVL